MEQNITDQVQSTPEQAPEPTGPQSFEEIFTNIGEGTSVETVNSEQAPAEGQPSGAPDTQQTVDNDQRRFQYWQSQADKRQNEIDRLAKQNEVLQNQLNVNLTSNQPAAEQEEQFPEPPRKPQQPHGFNRDEAVADPNSVSAQYLNQVEQWRDNMDEYNRLFTQYNVAKMQENVQEINNQRQEEMKQQAAEQQWRSQQNEAVEYIKGNFGATPEQAQDFVARYSDPKSVTMENLWKLYQLEAGQGVSQTQPISSGPSADFQQTLAAQQVPSPMGVVTGQSNSQTGSIEDQMMDAMVSDHNKKNYF